MRRVRKLLFFAIAAGLLGSGAWAAEPASPAAGGYGPLRLGMTQADAKAALDRVARDVVYLPTSPEHPSRDAASSRMGQMAVMTPWQDVYVGRLDPDTRIQVGAHAGWVVAVLVRAKLTAEGRACHDAFDALLRRMEAEFGPVPNADPPGTDEMFTDAKRKFDTWTLYVGRIQQRNRECDLSVDAIDNGDNARETAWRASLR